MSVHFESGNWLSDRKYLQTRGKKWKKKKVKKRKRLKRLSSKGFNRTAGLDQEKTRLGWQKNLNQDTLGGKEQCQR